MMFAATQGRNDEIVSTAAGEVNQAGDDCVQKPPEQAGLDADFGKAHALAMQQLERMQHDTCNMIHATWYVQHGTCNMIHAT